LRPDLVRYCSHEEAIKGFISGLERAHVVPPKTHALVAAGLVGKSEEKQIHVAQAAAGKNPADSFPFRICFSYLFTSSRPNRQRSPTASETCLASTGWMCWLLSLGRNACSINVVNEQCFFGHSPHMFEKQACGATGGGHNYSSNEPSRQSRRFANSSFPLREFWFRRPTDENYPVVSLSKVSRNDSTVNY
jgi:hypothetical protein